MTVTEQTISRLETAQAEGVITQSELDQISLGDPANGLNDAADLWANNFISDSLFANYVTEWIQTGKIDVFILEGEPPQEVSTPTLKSVVDGWRSGDIPTDDLQSVVDLWREAAPATGLNLAAADFDNSDISVSQFAQAVRDRIQWGTVVQASNPNAQQVNGDIEFTVTVDSRNVPMSRNVALTVDGVEQTRQTVSVPGGGSADVTATFAVEPGDYRCCGILVF